MAREVRDMEIDEISLVDRPANQHAKVSIAKRAQEVQAVSDYFDQDGQPVDAEALNLGDVVFDAEGQAFVLELEDEPELELELAGAGVSKSLADTVRSDLSKALTQDERNEAISKAMEEIAKADARVAAAENRASAAETIAKSERDLRLTREYISKAAEYNVPVDPTELGPVLMRMVESMTDADCAVIHKSLAAAGAMLFTEAGYQGGGDNADPMAQVNAVIDEAVSKAANPDRAQAISDYFEQNPQAYEEYLRAQAGR